MCNGAQAPAHPILKSLEPLVAQKRIKRTFLVRLVDARIEELERVGNAMQFASLDQLEEFGERTYSSLNYLTLQADGKQNVDLDHYASHLGKAAYIATVLRGISHHAAARRSFLPIDICAKRKLSQEKIYSGEPCAELSDVVLDVATRGRDHLLHAAELPARDQVQGLSLEHHMLDRFFRRLEGKWHFNVYQNGFGNDAFLPLYLWRHS